MLLWELSTPCILSSIVYYVYSVWHFEMYQNIRIYINLQLWSRPGVKPTEPAIKIYLGEKNTL